MRRLPGGGADLPQLQSTMLAIEQACSSIQMHANPTEAEKIIVSLHDSPMPYQLCQFILENSHMPIARFLAAAAIRVAALREWGLLTDEDKRNLIVFFLGFVMERASASDTYVQSKVSAVAAQLIKRGWQDFTEGDKAAIFLEVKRASEGIYGVDAQFAGMDFLESLVSEFSPSTATSMGLPREFHELCQSSFEKNYLKEFYVWGQNAAVSFGDKIVGSAATTMSEIKVCSAALRLMCQILNWSFKQAASVSGPSSSKTHAFSSGIRHDTLLLKKFERSLVEPGPAWHDVLISSGHTIWILNLYEALRQKYSSDNLLWIDSPLAVSARQLIVQLCSLSGSIFPSDNGQMQIKHLTQILSAIIKWIEPADLILEAITNEHRDSEVLDACHALLSIATLTDCMLFDNLLRSVRPFGTLRVLSTLTCEVVKAYTASADEDDRWSSEALDILLEAWGVVLGRSDFTKTSISTEAVADTANLFNVIVESYLNAAARTALDDDNQSEHFHASISRRDEMLRSYSLIARAAADVTVPFLVGLFSERVSLLLSQKSTNDAISLLEELYWLLLITGHVLTDSGEGETILVPEALQASFSNIPEEAQHPVVVLSWSIISFARHSLDPETRACYFSPRLMEAVIWFLARWADTYVMPLDGTKGHICTPHESQASKRVLHSFAGENDQGKLVLDTIIRISMVALSSYPGENELQTMTCHHLLVALVRRRNVCAHLVTLESWAGIANAFVNERTLFQLNARVQRYLAQALVSAAFGLKDSEASNQYVRNLLGPMTTYLKDISIQNNLKGFAQQADVIYTVICLMERLRGAMRATQPRTQKATFEMGHAVMDSLLTLLEVYKNQSAVVYQILKFVVDLVDAQVTFLNAEDTSILVSFCLQLLKVYSSHNIGKISLSLSSSLQSEAQFEKYKDLRALLQLLVHLCSKDLVDFSSGSDEVDSPEIANVVFIGLHIITPLISLDLLKYPKLSFDYFALLSHMLEVYPEKVAQLNKDAFAHIAHTLDFGLHCQDIDVVDRCLRAVDALVSYHFKSRVKGEEGLGAYAIDSQGTNGELQESILKRFLRILLQLLLFEDFRMELVGSMADALLPLLLCEHDSYQRMVHELLERQSNPDTKIRLADALQRLTSTNQLTSSLERSNRQRFRKNLQIFLTDISGYMRTK
ncbi:Nuclear transport receptor exportin 4 (importin beta superfamily) domain-containing protein [Dioscorea alata]|uniref:Nuclear transport receptor exportin 4 (Importin beta superfamily) domain-containing protein n=1 Tax=Dioscorea alata TaxID=55571 RepID=A0ACB7WSR6_DIOAL|nr:Nuclear transport receptor exportin 4 (importin beta superfamily) domain-containing protein [Dioscorea alata]